MKLGSEGDDGEIVAEINMIPLIDVALVLLIIFMVMTPVLVRSQINVNLPTARASQSSPDESLRFDIVVNRDGSIVFENQASTPDEVERALAERRAGGAEVAVVVSADKDVIFDKVVSVMDAVKKSGVTKVGVAVKPATR